MVQILDFPVPPSFLQAPGSFGAADGGTVGGSVYDRILLLIARACGAERRHSSSSWSWGSGRWEEVFNVYAQDRFLLLHPLTHLVLRMEVFIGFFTLFPKSGGRSNDPGDSIDPALLLGCAEQPRHVDQRTELQPRCFLLASSAWAVTKERAKTE